MMFDTTKQRNTGFTIVELLIVVVVIAILAAITIVSFNGISQRAEIVTVKSDLINASKQLETEKLTAGSLDPSVLQPYLEKNYNNAQIRYQYGDTDYSCLNATGIRNPQLQFHIETKDGVTQTKDGHCPATFTTATARCLDSNMYISITARNNFDTPMIITASNSNGLHLDNTDTIPPETFYAVSHNTQRSTVERGISTITVVGTGANSDYSRVHYHHYEAASC